MRLEPVLRTEGQFPLELGGDGLTDDGRRVAEDQRPVAQGEVDVAVAIDVPQLRAGPRSKYSGCGRAPARMLDVTPPGITARATSKRASDWGNGDTGTPAFTLSDLETPGCRGEPPPEPSIGRRGCQDAAAC